ncbi:MAG: F0F1 ATP synthase subunit A [Patescibacteria group bacterium]
MDIHISLAAQELFKLWGVSITNSMITGVVASTGVAILVVALARNMSLSPATGMRGVVDSASDWILSLIESVSHDRQKAIRFFPIAITIFFFVLINNWIGLLPGVGSIHIGGIPVFRGMTADLNATLALAVISLVLVHAYAIKELGIVSHIKKYVSFNPVLLFIGMLELTSDISKVLSFAFRLFGNIFAGEVLLIVISAIAPLVAPLPFFFLEIFVGFIQAFVFTLLTVVFFGIASSHGTVHTIGEAVE